MDLISYNTVLKAVSTSLPANSEKALRVGREIFDRIVSSPRMNPDEVTYGSMILAYRRLLEESDPRRRENIEKLLEECISQGLVGGFAAAQMRFEFSPEEMKEKWDIEPVEYNSTQEFRNILPKAWKNNSKRKAGRRNDKKSIPRRREQKHKVNASI